MTEESGGGTLPKVTVECAFCLSPNTIVLASAGDRPMCEACGKPMLLDRPVKVSEEAFDRTVLDTDAPVLVDFYADWCGPCKMVAPIVDEIARANVGRLLVTKVDTDRAPGLSARFGIRGVPTLIFFRGGEEFGRSVGLEPEKLKELTRDILEAS